ncbi:hypothetical protein [Breoghania sp.]|uniref:hypothetical protein n=1 Tax=Breoghania sp. TaxID=2065378 RepID=UPI002AA923F0|nr:hypothetical protein [Breoghania sp.]
MPIQFHGISYPNTIDKVEKDFRLLRLVAAFSKDKQFENKISFLKKTPKNREVYEKYLREGAPAKIDISATLQKITSTILQLEDKANPALWDKLAKQIEKELTAELNGKVLPDFYGSKAFFAFHRKNLKLAANAKYGTVDQVAKRLGIKKSLNLEFLIDNMLRKDASEMKKEAAKVIKAQKLKVDEKTLIQAIEKKQKLPGK